MLQRHSNNRPTLRTIGSVAFTLMLLSALPASAQTTGLIPPERCIDWTQAGIPGGIPQARAIQVNVDPAFGDGITDATSIIQMAIDICDENRAVYLPEGKYKTTQTIHLSNNKTIRGDGPGKTIISFEGDWGRSIIDMRGSFYWDITGLKRCHGITGGGVKGSTQLTLDSAAGISAGDILLIDQLNDPQLVDINGFEGPCTYCGREDGTRARGQIVEVVAVNGTTVTTNLPLYWTLSAALLPQATLVNASSMVRRAGIEDLTITEPNPVVDYLIEMDGAQYCWLRNVEVERLDQRGLWLIESLQNEIRDCSFHNAINGFGRSHGYGILADAYSSANLIENNILRTLDGGFLMTAGGASGNVFGYNYMIDTRFDDPWWLTASPSISHAPHPSMNLWEGNIGIQAGADFIHGSSSHNTMFRCRFSGWQDSVITSNNNAIELQYKCRYMNVLGCVLGTAGKSDTYEAAFPATADNALRTIWRLGYGGPSWAGDTLVRATLLRHRNFDHVTKSIIDDPTISQTSLPASFYRYVKPSWWGNLAWPPIGPDVNGLMNKIPAQVRYEQSIATGAESGFVSSAHFTLAQNYPNPFQTATKVSFSLPVAAVVRLSVLDLYGREVAVLADGMKPPGSHQAVFRANNLPGGMYMYRFISAGHVLSKRMMVIK
jgi:hypothetical protein